MNAERLRQLLSYDSETGEFTRLVSAGSNAKVGSVAGSIRPHLGGYKCYIIGVDGRKYQAHRLAWLYVHGSWPRDLIDHIDGNSLNNRISNLREATRSENSRNRGATVKNQSGFKGVSWEKHLKKWRAKINVHGKRKHLGLFDSAELAHAAYCEAATQIHGEFARFA
jgi:hypothetical protein